MIESCSWVQGGDRSPRTARVAAVVDQAGGEADGCLRRNETLLKGK